MTVKDLIKILDGYHPDCQIVVAADKPLDIISSVIRVARLTIGGKNLPAIYIGDDKCSS